MHHDPDVAKKPNQGKAAEKNVAQRVKTKHKWKRTETFENIQSKRKESVKNFEGSTTNPTQFFCFTYHITP